MSLVDARRRGGVRETESAAAVLGADHPLVRALRRLATMSEQAAVVAGVSAAAAAGVLAGVPGTPAVAIAAIVVATGLVWARLQLRATMRGLAIDLILGGRGDVAVKAVARERARLSDPAHRHALAGWLDEVRREAEDPRRRVGAVRPLFSARVVAQAAPELAELAERLPEGEVSVRAMAMTEQLLSRAATSPLYGHDPDALRWQLRRIRLTLGG
jgi:hypothetical protein